MFLVILMSAVDFIMLPVLWAQSYCHCHWNRIWAVHEVSSSWQWQQVYKCHIVYLGCSCY